MSSFFIQPKNAWWWGSLALTAVFPIVGIVLSGLPMIALDLPTVSISFLLYIVPSILGIWLFTKSRYAMNHSGIILTTAFLWGSFIATTLSVIFGFTIGHLTTLTNSTIFSASFGGAIPEEPLKLLCAIFVLHVSRNYVHHPTHAMLIGMAVGFGFDLNENMSYGIAAALSDANTDIETIVNTWGIRLLVGPLAHTIWTGISAYGIGLFYFNKQISGIKWLFFSMSIHFLFNTQWPFDVLVGPALAEPVSLTVVTLLYLCSLGIFIWLYRSSRSIGGHEVQGLQAGYSPNQIV